MRFRDIERNLFGITPDSLLACGMPDDQVSALWVSFQDPDSGCSYRTIYVLRHITGPYILMTQQEKNIHDLRKVAALVAMHHSGARVDGNVSNRINDIAVVLKPSRGKFPIKFQRWIVTKIREFYEQNFESIMIEKVFFKRVPHNICV